MVKRTLRPRLAPRGVTTLAAVAALTLSLVGGVAFAHEESEAEDGPLEVEARPAVVPVDGVLYLEVEYEQDDDTDDEEADSDSDGDTADGEADSDADGDTEDGEDEESAESAAATAPTTVTFTVDWGDGSATEPWTVTEQDAEEDEFEATGTHVYGTAGTYPVTVTADTDTGEQASAQVLVDVGQGAARVAGGDRLDTAVDISRESFPEDGSASAVLLARADHYADALAAASVAALEDAPVLLSDTGTLAPAVLDEIDRAMAPGGTVYLLGGEQALSAEVAAALEQQGHTVVRIAGDDRIETALQLAEFVVAAGAEFEEVVLASAANFPDALAAAAFAASVEAPVLLTGPDALDPRVAAFLDRHRETIEEVLLAGGPAAVSTQVERDITALGLEVERFAGEDRFETAVEIAERLFPDATSVVLATGTNFADALAGAAQAGRLDAPVLLVDEQLPDDVRDYLEERAGTITVVYTLGGDAAVSQAVMDEASTILGLD